MRWKPWESSASPRPGFARTGPIRGAAAAEGPGTPLVFRAEGRRAGITSRDPIELAVATLETALVDDSAAVRIQAARALGKIGSPAAALARD